MVRLGVGLASLLLVSTASAQLSGGSFGGSGDFGGGGGGGSSWGSGGGSSWGGSSSNDDWAERERERAEERRREEEERRRAEEERRRREEEERRRREEEERRRREEEARQLAADRALPPQERAALRSRFVETPVTIPRPSAPDPGRSETSFVPTPALGPTFTQAAAPERGLSATWGLLCGLLGFAGTFGAIGVLGRAFGAARRASSRGGRVRRGSCELRRISIAFDARERAAIQAVLVDLSKRLDLRTPEGRHRAADEVVRQLVGRLGAARYAAWSSRFSWPSGAKGVLQQILADVKSRYRHDVTRGDRVDVRARAEEGEGLVVVSVVIGSTRWLPALPTRLGPTELAQALHDSVRIPTRDFVALEVIWSPALEQDRMSSVELETIYPELLRLDGGPLGRASCGFCGAVHAAELGRCPACGAPSGASAGAPYRTR